MDPVSPLPAMVALLIAFATSFLLVKQVGAPPLQGRYASIDGLRGYLAFFVFLHHACIWYFYLRTGRWETPPSNLYTHFGEGSVALFFMITGFLFFSKLIDGRSKPIDWGKLFVSRFLRLGPLYLFLMFLFFLLVAYLSKGSLQASGLTLMKGVVQWLGFRITGAPDLNGVEHIATTVAGITWSLPYEWFFYFSLPILALTVRVTPPSAYIALGLASLASVFMWDIKARFFLPFLGGVTAAFLVRSDSFRRVAVSKISSVLALGCVGLAVIAFPSGYKVMPLVLFSVAFALIACGNSLFGVLVSPTSRMLGEFAYGIYLLHSITLFVVFTFVLGILASKTLTPLVHWLVVMGTTPVLIAICFLTFRLIERPAMQRTSAVTHWLRAHLTQRLKGQTASP